MASKRSKVQQLQQVRPATPVARPVDTFVQYKPPVRGANTGTELLKALAEISPTLAKVAQSNRESRIAGEKANIDAAFLSDPVKFVADFKSGKFSNLSSPAQVLAGEYLGKRLARKYGAELNQKYQQEGLGASEDTAAFMAFEEAERSRFIQENKDIFGQAGVVGGFTSKFREYTSRLDSEHISNATSNLVTNQQAGFRELVQDNIESFLAGTLSENFFGLAIKYAQDDFKVGFGFNNSVTNKQTMQAIVDYAQQAPNLTYAQRLGVLNLAYRIETTKGSYLGNTGEAELMLGKARVAIDKQEDQRLDKENKLYTRSKTLVKDEIQAAIISGLRKNSNTPITDILSVNQLANAAAFYPEYLRYYEDQKNFFTNEGKEVDGEDLIAMRLELAKARTTEDARTIISGWQSSGRLKNNTSVFNTLWSQADKIKTMKEGKEPDFSQDKVFKFYYRRLSGVPLEDGFSAFPPKDPRFEVMGDFFNAFLDLFYTENYQSVTQMEQEKLLRPIYEFYLSKIKEATPDGNAVPTQY